MAKRQKKSKSSDKVNKDSPCPGGDVCPSPTVCEALSTPDAKACVLEQVAQFIPSDKPGTAPVPGGKQGKY